MFPSPKRLIFELEIQYHAQSVDGTYIWNYWKRAASYLSLCSFESRLTWKTPISEHLEAANVSIKTISEELYKSHIHALCFKYYFEAMFYYALTNKIYRRELKNKNKIFERTFFVPLTMVKAWTLPTPIILKDILSLIDTRCSPLF